MHFCRWKDDLEWSERSAGATAFDRRQQDFAYLAAGANAFRPLWLELVISDAHHIIAKPASCKRSWRASRAFCIPIGCDSASTIGVFFNFHILMIDHPRLNNSLVLQTATSRVIIDDAVAAS